MRRFLLPLLFLALGLAAVPPPPAHAVLITVNFSFPYVEAAPGSPPQTATGSFSFDQSLLPSPGGWVNVSDPWSLSFTFAGHTFTSSDATLALHTDSAGRFQAWSLLSSPNTLQVAPGFVLDAFAGFAPTGTIRGIEVSYWTVPNQTFASTSSGRWDVSVPEPATLALVALGLLPMAARWRRRRQH